MIIREEEYKFRKKTAFYLLAFLHSVFRSDHLQRLRSCDLIGPRTSTCPDEQNIGSRDTHRLHCIEAEIRVAVLGHPPRCGLADIA